MSSIEINKKINFSKVCRLCMNEANGLVSVFSKNLIEENEILFSEMIIQCASVQVFEEDSLPKGICLKCIERLNNAYSFRKLCENTEHNLYKLLNEIEDQFSKDIQIKSEFSIDIVEENMEMETNDATPVQNFTPCKSYPNKSSKGSSRTYIRKSNRGNWEIENLKKAIFDISQGYSVRRSAKKYKVPEATIRRKIKVEEEKRYTDLRMGCGPTFTHEQEEELTEQALKLSLTGGGLTCLQLRKLAYDYAERNSIKHKFNKKTEVAGRDWFFMYKQRHPELNLKRRKSGD